jgi:hypothetical protein
MLGPVHTGGHQLDYGGIDHVDRPMEGKRLLGHRVVGVRETWYSRADEHDYGREQNG